MIIDKVKLALSWVENNGWMPSKATKNAKLWSMYFGISSIYNIHHWKWKKKIDREYYIELSERLGLNWLHMTKNKLYSFIKHKSLPLAKFPQVPTLRIIELLLHPTRSPDLVPSGPCGIFPSLHSFLFWLSL